MRADCARPGRPLASEDPPVGFAVEIVARSGSRRPSEAALSTQHRSHTSFPHPRARSTAPGGRFTGHGCHLAGSGQRARYPTAWTARPERSRSQSHHLQSAPVPWRSAGHRCRRSQASQSQGESAYASLLTGDLEARHHLGVKLDPDLMLTQCLIGSSSWTLRLSISIPLPLQESAMSPR